MPGHKARGLHTQLLSQSGQPRGLQGRLAGVSRNSPRRASQRQGRATLPPTPDFHSRRQVVAFVSARVSLLLSVLVLSWSWRAAVTSAAPRPPPHSRSQPAQSPVPSGGLESSTDVAKWWNQPSPGLMPCGACCGLAQVPAYPQVHTHTCWAAGPQWTPGPHTRALGACWRCPDKAGWAPGLGRAGPGLRPQRGSGSVALG